MNYSTRWADTLMSLLNLSELKEFSNLEHAMLNLSQLKKTSTSGRTSFGLLFATTTESLTPLQKQTWQRKTAPARTKVTRQLEASRSKCLSSVVMQVPLEAKSTSMLSAWVQNNTKLLHGSQLLLSSKKGRT